MAATINIGIYKVGEIPAPIVVTLEDSDEVALNLSGYTAKWVYRRADGTSVTNAASLVSGGTTGQTTYTWADDDFEEPGNYEGEMWAGNGTNRFTSVTYSWKVIPAVADTTPAI